jgi:UDP-N-acetylglucosamine/UDP-N-acetylgalactosamine diphosphorylase
MTSKTGLEGIRRHLREHHQEHLLAFWAELSAEQQENLLDQVRELDLAEICDWVERLVKNRPEPPVQHKEFTPVSSYGPDPTTETDGRKYRHALDLVESVIAASRVACLTVAGGQGGLVQPHAGQGNTRARYVILNGAPRSEGAGLCREETLIRGPDPSPSAQDDRIRLRKEFF